MGDDFDFRTMLRAPAPKPRRKKGNVVWSRPRKPPRLGKILRLGVAGLLIGSLAGVTGLHWSGNLPDWGNRPDGVIATLAEQRPSDLGVGCIDPLVVDGDTLRCGSTRIRLSSIDAPEMPGHCRPGRQCTPGDPYASAANLQALVADVAVECRQVDTDHYGRAVAFCNAGGRDISCEQVRAGHAVMRYGTLSC